jgi:hypothetical protein
MGDGMPLLDNAQIPHRDEEGMVGVPYPPTAYNQPPHGYTPPGLRRMGSGMSGTSSGVGGDGDIGGFGGRGYPDPYAGSGSGQERRW